ncbi:class I SAM-dependent methyltransferase [Calothrix sp. PCC 6303]|uniref:class I SAM-dependent methyltransferase n=1 Tax=Calothrix sp. PCC 6303 TaxID=1170562 RepID=UPI0002A02CFC|nr:methyltransferase domain-containing protein [Calothrix sp. PCC 6303]AFZ01565.1 Methyltransferase type 11 [Calothrix sp. PCC 6303]
MMTELDPVQQEYSRIAHKYDRRWSFYIEATIQATLSRLDIHSGDRILDLGCGTGTLIQNLLKVAPETEIVGLDPSAEMLNVARQKLPAAIDLKVGSATSIPFSSNSFDVLISTSAFHYFPNPDLAIQEMQRVLKPGGFLLITDWCHDYRTCQILDLALRMFNRAHFRTYRVSECQNMLQDAGLDEVVIERYKIDWFWGMMTAKAMKQVAVA